MEKTVSGTEELVRYPSRATSGLLEIITDLAAAFDSRLGSKNPFVRFAAIYEIRMYAVDGYKAFYDLLKNYRIPSDPAGGRDRITMLIAEFKRLYSGLIINNLALGSLCLRDGGRVPVSPVMTVEDEKIASLKKLSRGEMAPDAFRGRFGHYALDAYELSSRRFEEYSDEELAALARLASNIDVKEKISIDAFITADSKETTGAIIAIREFAKHKILYIVRDIRKELLLIADKDSISDIFSAPLL